MDRGENKSSTRDLTGGFLCWLILFGVGGPMIHEGGHQAAAGNTTGTFGSEI